MVGNWGFVDVDCSGLLLRKSCRTIVFVHYPAHAPPLRSRRPRARDARATRGFVACAVETWSRRPLRGMHGAEGVPTEGVPTALGPGDFFLSYEENQVTEILPYCILGHEKITDVAILSFL